MTQHEPQERRGWRARAACRNATPDQFFPTAESGPVRAAQEAAAKAVCARCPVRQECLDEALRRIPYGICGGLTEHERRQLRTTPATSQPIAATRPADPSSIGPRTAVSDEVPAAVREVLSDGPGRWLSGRERAGVGRALLAAGRTPRQVARLCGVTERSAARWATPIHTSTTSPTDTDTGTGTGAAGCGGGSNAGEGSAAATGLPSGSPQHTTARQAHEHRKEAEGR
jgi:WhiB family transcriptional regulator, redox-sensing transcriptional regulator